MPRTGLDKPAYFNPRSFFINQWDDVKFKSGSEPVNKNAQCEIDKARYFDNFLKTLKPHTRSKSELKSGYSTTLKTCVLYFGIKFDYLPGCGGPDLDKEYLRDLSGGRELYHMTYGLDKSGNEVVISSASSFLTKQEFTEAKNRVFK